MAPNSAPPILNSRSQSPPAAVRVAKPTPDATSVKKLASINFPRAKFMSSLQKCECVVVEAACNLCKGTQYEGSLRTATPGKRIEPVAGIPQAQSV